MGYRHKLLGSKVNWGTMGGRHRSHGLNIHRRDNGHLGKQPLVPHDLVLGRGRRRRRHLVVMVGVVGFRHLWQRIQQREQLISQTGQKFVKGIRHTLINLS